jgi:hypothetical protein
MIKRLWAKYIVSSAGYCTRHLVHKKYVDITWEPYSYCEQCEEERKTKDTRNLAKALATLKGEA